MRKEGGSALCVEIGFSWTYLENEIKQFLSYFGIFHAIADSILRSTLQFNSLEFFSCFQASR